MPPKRYTKEEKVQILNFYQCNGFNATRAAHPGLGKATLALWIRENVPEHFNLHDIERIINETPFVSNAAKNAILKRLHI